MTEPWHLHRLLARDLVPAFGFAHRPDVDDIRHPAGTAPEYHDAIGQIYRLFHAVGNEQDRARIDPRDPDQLLLHHHSGLGIERAERLVHQQHLRLDRVGAGDGDPLLHAARKLVREIVLRPRHSHEGEILAGQLFAPPPPRPPAFYTPPAVLVH